MNNRQFIEVLKPTYCAVVTDNNTWKYEWYTSLHGIWSIIMPIVRLVDE